MDGYRAKVRVLAVVDGERREFAPGEPLPELDSRDVEQLVAMQAIERDPNSDAAPLEGGAGAAGGADAGTHTTASEAAKGAGDSPAPGAGAEPPAGSDQPEPAPEPQPAARRVRRTKE